MRALLLATMVLAGSALSQQGWAEPQAKPAAKPVKVVAAAASATTVREPSKRVQDQQEAMKALAFLDGEWRGTAKTVRKTGTVSMTQTVRSGAMLDGAMRMLEVRSYEADGRLSFDALRIISYNADRKTYEMRSYQNGSVRDYEVSATASGLTWQIESGGKVSTRYEIAVKNGVWTETATRMSSSSRAGAKAGPNSAADKPETYLSISVKRQRPTTWPAAGALGAK
jgi:hypothetical protein